MEISLVIGILITRYDSGFVVITALSLSTYIVFTVVVSNWRIGLRRLVNEVDSAANTQAIDSPLNYETVNITSITRNSRPGVTTSKCCAEKRRNAKPDFAFLVESWAANHHQPGPDCLMWRRCRRRRGGHMTLGDLAPGQRFPDPALHAS